MNRLLLIDGNSLTYRAYYGSAVGPSGILTNSDGIPVNAILTLNRMIQKAIDTYKPSHIFVAFDAGKKTDRHDKLENYKAGRQATPNELIVQFPLVKEMLFKMGINTFELSGIEADDIIGTLAKKYESIIDVLVLSSDRDLYQLVSDKTTVIVPQSGGKDDLVIKNSEFEMLQGYLPSQVPDMKGLVGDSSDNLKGVEGIGPKGALKLIQEYKSLENIYENIENIKGSTKDKLIASKDMAFLCKELGTLLYDVEIPFTLEQMEYKFQINPSLLDFFRKYHLNSLLTKYEKLKKLEKKDDQLFFDNLIL